MSYGFSFVECGLAFQERFPGTYDGQMHRLWRNIGRTPLQSPEKAKEKIR